MSLLARSISILFLGACPLAPAALCQTQIYKVPAMAAHELYAQVAAIGDLDFDGQEEFAALVDMNAPPYFTGKLRIFLGRNASVLGELNLAVSGGTAFGFASQATLERLGDVTGDGIGDLAVGFPSDTQGGNQAGKVYVVSGATGAIVYTYLGGQFEEAGFQVGGPGDVDGDGTPDMLLALPGKAVGSLLRAGEIQVRSGATGGLLTSVQGSQQYEWLGWSLDGAGDIDGDTHPDFVAGGQSYQMLKVFSGASGAPIHQIYVGMPTVGGSLRVAGPGDMDGDGVPDLVCDPPLATPYGLQVRSGFDGSVLAELPTSGSVMRAPGDLDGDGLADLWAGTPGNGLSFGGYVDALAGGTWTKLFQVPGTDSFGWYLSSGDVNGDGMQDLVGGNSPLNYIPNIEQYAYVGAWSGTQLGLWSPSYSLALAQGGSQSLKLSPPSAYTGSLYLLLGSASGTSPGIALAPNVLLPLVADGYTSYTLGNPNYAPLSQSFGVLTGSPTQAAAFSLPAGSVPGLSGLTVDHAYAVIDPVTLAIPYASNAVPLYFVP